MQNKYGIWLSESKIVVSMLILGKKAIYNPLFVQTHNMSTEQITSYFLLSISQNSVAFVTRQAIPGALWEIGLQLLFTNNPSVPQRVQGRDTTDPYRCVIVLPN